MGICKNTEIDVNGNIKHIDYECLICERKYQTKEQAEKCNNEHTESTKR